MLKIFCPRPFSYKLLNYQVKLLIILMFFYDQDFADIYFNCISSDNPVSLEPCGSRVSHFLVCTVDNNAKCDI